MKFDFNGEIIDIAADRVVNAGYAGCDQDLVKAHIDELAKIGVAVPKHVPTYYPVPALQLTQENVIQVGHGQTSCEAEYVYIRCGGKEYITVGSDHSDRWLESFSVNAAKQICPDVIAKEIWSFDDVKDHMDKLMLRSFVFENGNWRLYQEGPASAILSPDKLVELGKGVVPEEGDLILYSGTIPTIGDMCFASKIRFEMEDLLLNKVISAEYAVKVLPECIE